MLSVAVLALIILAMAALITSTVRSEEKANRVGLATQELNLITERALYGLEWDDPPGTRASFWAAGPGAAWTSGTSQPGDAIYAFAIYAETVPGLGDAPTATRLKKMNVRLNWWDSQAQGGSRQGYGRLELHSTRLVRERVP